MSEKKLNLTVILLCSFLSLHGQQPLANEEIYNSIRTLSIEKWRIQKSKVHKTLKTIEVDALPIYWMVYTGDSSLNHLSYSSNEDGIFAKLSFTLHQQPKPSLNDTLDQTVFSSLIYDIDSGSLLSKLSEGKYICDPSALDEALFKIAREVGAKRIFYVMNLFVNWPSFIVDRNNKVFVYYSFIKKGEKNYTNKVVPIEEFISKNQDVLKFIKSNWLTWR